ncbi:hypothetical protein IWW38_002986, partial [Coemansia aciculifera]
AWTAFWGAAGCFAVMLFVDMVSALISTSVVILLFLYVHYTCPPKPWGDVTQSLIYHQCRKFMLRLDLRKDHVKFWRPQILLLVHNPRSSLHLIRFCNALKKGGLYVIGHVIKGRFYDMLPEFRQQESAWMRLIDVLHVKAFLNLVIDKEDDSGARSIVFGAGLGGMRPNIVVMGFLNLAHRLDSAPDACLDEYCDGFMFGCSDAAVDDMELPTDNIKLNSPISAMAYVRIIEDVLMMGKAVGIAHGFSKLGSVLPPIPHLDMANCQHSSEIAWQTPLTAETCSTRNAHSKQYIDLWPIQIGTATTVASDDGTRQASYLTNFDSYVMVLQLGTVLHLVPYWNKHYTLRVMCFVENKSDVAEEYRRVDKLLRDLRVMAELHVHYLRDAGLSTYDEALRDMAAQQPSIPSGGAQQQQRDAVTSPSGHASVSVAIRQPAVASLADDCGLVTGAFSMKVNLPMPLRYEASKARRRSSGTISSSSSEEDSDLETESPPVYNDDDVSREASSALPRYATVSGAEMMRSRRTASGGAFWRKRRMSADPNRGRQVIIGNLPLGSKDVDISMRPRRRGSDGAMVLSDFYSRTLAAVASQVATSANPQPTSAHGNCDVLLEELSAASHESPPPSSPPPAVCPGRALKSFTFVSAPELAAAGSSTANGEESAGTMATATTTDFNDMTVNTQNRILNEMIRRECNNSTTALIFTTLQAPEPGTSDSETKAMEYLKDIDALAHDLPPVFLVHATSLTVTTSL